MQVQRAERSFPALILASRIERAAESGRPDEGWTLKSLAGRMIEISGVQAAATLTAAASLVLQAQLVSEPSIWIAVGGTSFYPPDLAESGIDLDALPVVRVSTPTQGARAADCLLRSGGAAIVVLDLVDAPSGTIPRKLSQRVGFQQNSSQSGTVVFTSPKNVEPQRAERQSFDNANTFSISTQARLAGLAKKHETVLLCLTRKDRDLPSLGSMVSLRGTGAVRKTAFDRFLWTFEVLKDKHRGPGWTHSEACRGPAGLH